MSEHRSDSALETGCFQIQKIPPKSESGFLISQSAHIKQGCDWETRNTVLLLGVLVVTSSVQILDSAAAMLYSVYTPKSGAGNLSGSESRC